MRWLIEAKSYDINIKDTIGMKMINYAALRKTKVAKSIEKKDQVDIPDCYYKNIVQRHNYNIIFLHMRIEYKCKLLYIKTYLCIIIFF